MKTKNKFITLANRVFKKGEIITFNDLLPYERGKLAQRLMLNREQAKIKLDKWNKTELQKSSPKPAINYKTEITDYIIKTILNKQK